MKKNLHIIILTTVFSFIIWASISLSNDFYVSYKVPIKLINIPEGYSVASSSVENVNVRLKAKGWKLIGIFLTDDLDYIVSIDNESGKHQLKLSNSLVENSWINSEIQLIDFYPASVTVLIDKSISKKVKVLLIVEMNYAEGFGIASDVLVKPDSIVITGAESRIKDITGIETESLSLQNIDGKYSEVISIKKIPEFTFSEEKVRIDFDVQKIVDNEFNSIPVTLLGIPPDRDVLLIPDAVSVSLRGGINILGKLKTDDIKLTLKYADVISDTLGSVVPEVVLPPHTQLVFINPDKVRYIIKKY